MFEWGRRLDNRVFGTPRSLSPAGHKAVVAYEIALLTVSIVLFEVQQPPGRAWWAYVAWMFPVATFAVLWLVRRPSPMRP